MLKKLARRTFLKNKWKFLATGLMAFFVVLLWMGTAASSLPIRDNLELMQEQPYNQEDFQLQTYSELTSEDISYLEDTYNITIEDIQYKLVNSEVKMDQVNSSLIWNVSQGTSAVSSTSTASVSVPDQAYFQTLHEDVDVQYFLEGEAPTKNNEIAVSPHFAEAYGVSVGDTIKISYSGEDHEFIVSGIYGDPGFVAIASPSVPLSDPTKLNLFLVNEETYNSIDVNTKDGESLSNIYGATFNDPNLTEDEMTAIYADIRTEDLFNKTATTCFPNPYDPNGQLICDTSTTNVLINLQTKDNNLKISMGETTVSSKTTSTMVLSLFISLIVIVVMMIITSKIIDGYRKQIGVLKAFGYEKNKIIRAFYIYPIIFFAIPIILGVIVAAGLANYFISMYADMFVFLPTSFSLFAIENSVMLIIIFTTYFVGTYFAINKVVKQDTLSLFSGVANRHKKVRKIKIKRSFKLTFKTRLLLSSPGKMFAIFLGIVASAALIGYAMLLVWGIVDTFNTSMQYANYDAATYYKQVETDKPTETEFYATAFDIVSVDYNHTLDSQYQDINAVDQVTIPIFGTSVDNPGFNIETVDKDTNVEKAMNNGIVVSGMMASTYGIQVGDVINVKTPYSSDLLTYEVTGIAVGSGSSINFIDIDQLLNDMNMDDNTRNANMVEDASTIKAEDYARVTSKQQMANALFASLGMLFITIFIMGLISFGIMLPIISSLSTIIIKDNVKNIGVMKAFGYTKREIKSIILNIYTPIVIIGSGVGYIVAYFITEYINKILTKMLGYGLTIEFNWWMLLFVILIVFLVYILNIEIASRKINKVNVKEVLTKE